MTDHMVDMSTRPMGRETKRLGRIDSITLGAGGYDDAMFGVTFRFGGEDLCVGDFWGYWASLSEGAKWTRANQIDALGKMCLKLNDLMRQAKVKSFADLKGVPVEVTFDGQVLRSWRILREVIA